MNDLPGPEAATIAPEDYTITSFRLYIASGTHASSRALVNLQKFCDDYFPNRYKTEVIDILREPLRALSEGVLLTPTLLRVSPLPRCRIVGDLSDTNSILFTLGLKRKGEK